MTHLVDENALKAALTGIKKEIDSHSGGGGVGTPIVANIVSVTWEEYEAMSENPEAFSDDTLYVVTEVG